MTATRPQTASKKGRAMPATAELTVEQRARESFERDVADHRLTVLRDDGLYRHLRCMRPGTYTYGFDLVTWPGYLAIVGDCGHYVFSRIRDMFEFFEGNYGGINPQYWAEKLQAPRGEDGARSYSYDLYRRRVQEWLEDQCEDMDADQAEGLRTAVREQLLDEWLGVAHSEHEAHRLLYDFEHQGRRLYEWGDPWELREYDHQFLWCCHAIVWAIARYRHREAWL